MRAVFLGNFIERSRARISHTWDHINMNIGELNVSDIKETKMLTDRVP
jgi:hypothetical protein